MMNFVTALPNALHATIEAYSVVGWKTKSGFFLQQNKQCKGA